MVVVGRRVLYKADLDMRVSDITPSKRTAVSRPVEPIRMAFLLVPQFPMLAFASAIEPSWSSRSIAALSLANSSGLFMVESLMGVATAPGPTFTTDTPWGANSTPAVRVSMRTPPLATQ